MLHFSVFYSSYGERAEPYGIWIDVIMPFYTFCSVVSFANVELDVPCCVGNLYARAISFVVFKPLPAVIPNIKCFKLFPLFPVRLSFACRHLACLIFLMQPVTPSRIRKARCSTIHKI